MSHVNRGNRAAWMDDATGKKSRGYWIVEVKRTKGWRTLQSGDGVPFLCETRKKARAIIGLFDNPADRKRTRKVACTFDFGKAKA